MAVTAPALPELRAGEHFRLLVWARWQSYRNALRRSGMLRLKFLTALFTYLLAAVGGLGSALAFLGLGYSAASRGKVAVTGIGTFLIFALWQLAPVIFEATTPTLKFRDIARYPISFRTFYALHLAYGLIDPAVLVGVAWLLFLWLGLLAGRAAWALHALVPFLLFAACNLFANRFVITLLERLLATRRGRERVLLGVMLLLVAFQFAFYGFMPRAGAAGIKSLGRSLLPWWTWSPPGLPAWTADAAAAQYLAALGVLLAYSLIAAGLLRWQLRSVFSGETFSETQRRSGAVQVTPGWSLPFFSERLSAIVEKELRYHLRDTRTLVNMAMPAVFALTIAISRGAFTRTMAVGLKIQSSSPRIQVMFTSAAVFMLGYLACNSFGYESSGFQRWTLTSATARQVLIGKNVAVALLWAASMLVVNLVLVASGPYSLRLLGVTLIAVVFAGLMVLAAGNQFSVRLPVRVEVGLTSKAMSEGAIFGSLLLFVAIGAAAWGTFALARWLSRPWITPAGLALFAGVAAWLYSVSLSRAARYLESNSEKISAELQ